MLLPSHFFVISLLALPLDTVTAFQPRISVQQQQQRQQELRQGTTSSRRDVLPRQIGHHHEHPTATTTPRRFLSAPTGTAFAGATAINRRRLGHSATASEAAGPAASGDSARGGRERTTPTKCGATSDCPAGLTRAEVMRSSIQSLTAAAGLLLLEPRRAGAQVEGGNGPSGEAVVAGVAGGGGVNDIPEARYTVGTDEVGVLFGDGSIGVKLGENPLKASGVCRVYVTEVLQGSQAIRQASLRAGFGVAAVAGTPAEKLEPKEVAELIRLSPRPMEIVFRNPELLGKRLQAEADKKVAAKRRDKQKAAEDAASPATPASRDAAGELRVTQVGKKPTVCGTKTKAGDLIEFRYSARLANDLSVEFDSSDRRGTGLPYAVMLGNGDVVKGLDLSLFDMCVGERRKIEIPARLAYGRKGSKTFGIPADDGLGSADVVYGVELVSINFRSDAADRRDNFYTDDPCDAAAIAAGNASGMCSR